MKERSKGPVLWLVFTLLITKTFAVQPADLQLSPGFSTPSGIAVDPSSDSLYVCDRGNNRVLRYDNRNSLTSSSAPTVAIGQSTLSSTAPNNGQAFPSPVGFNTPFGVTVDAKGTLWVSDSNNNRVVWFANASSIVTGVNTRLRSFGTTKLFNPRRRCKCRSHELA